MNQRFLYKNYDWNKYIFVCTSVNSGDYHTAKNLSKNISDSIIITTNELIDFNFSFKKESVLILLDNQQLNNVDIKKISVIYLGVEKNKK